MNTRILEGMDDWVDADVAAFKVGSALGLLPSRYKDIPNAKALLWSENPVSHCLGTILMSLVEVGYLERDDEREQFRLKLGFEIRVD